MDKPLTKKQLVGRIIQANEFYRTGAPIMSDVEYDFLLDQLKDIDPKHPLLGIGVIDSQPIVRKERLPIPMYSLNKVKTYDELLNWVVNKDLPVTLGVVITPKLDGISLVDTKGEEAWTRGDGEFGQRCVDHYKLMNTFNPKSTKLNEDMITYGEAIMSNDNFIQFKDKFATARNLVGGLLNRDIPTEELKYVDYIRYGVNKDWDKVGQLMYCNEINSVDIPYQLIPIYEINEELLNNLYQEWSKDYCIDGLVIDVNDSKIRQKLGRESNNNPAYAVAYKNAKWNKSIQSTVLGITWEVSKNGKLKPVINISPVDFNGVKISNITGYNAAYVYDNNIAKNSVIELTRSGDVIPKHLNTIYYDEEQVKDLMDEMSLCPSCGNPVRWDKTMTELVCTCETCKQKVINKMVHFFKTIGVEEFGKPSIEQLYDEGFEDIVMILNIAPWQLADLDGWGEKSARIVIEEFKKLKEGTVPLAKLMHALDLFDGKLGERDAQLILDGMDENQRNLFLNTKIDLYMDFAKDLCKIKGVSDITAIHFVQGRNWFNQFWGFNVHLVPFTIFKEKKVGGRFSGISVCMTGFRDAEIEKSIIDGGGTIASGVSKNLTYLVVKDMNSTSSKMVKAKKDGVEIISLPEFKIFLSKVVGI
jgi:NAD-dependent DNA ligase